MKTPHSVPLLGLGALLAGASYTIAADAPPPPKALIRAHPISTPVKIDPKHPPRIGEAFYPLESKRLREQGTCMVKVTIKADGSTRDASITKSTGFPRLDQACLQALVPGKFIPATTAGNPVEVTQLIPIVWVLR